MEKLKILEAEFEFDFYDADELERVEQAFKTVEKTVHKYMNKKTITSSEVIRNVCNIIFDFFNCILGEGADKKIFGNKTNLKMCLDAFEQFVEAKVKQDKEFEKISNKYSPDRIRREV